MKVVDVSPRGLLIESEIRLTPGAAICLNIETDETSHLVGGRVARVDAALSDTELKYRAGIALDSPFPPFDVVAAERGVAQPGAPQPKAPGQPAQPKPHDFTSAQKTEDQERELARVQNAFSQQKLHYEQSLAVIETLKAALRVNERSRADNQEARKKERESWEHQRHALEEAVERARSHEQETAAQVLASVSQQHALEERLEQERAAWNAERAALQEEVAQAKTLPSDAVRELQALREGRAVLERAVEEKRTTIAELVQHKERLTAEIEALRAKVDEMTRVRGDAETRYERSDAEKRKLEHLLHTTENWCADQQELIYELAQQMLSSYARIQAWSSSERRRPRGAQQAAGDTGTPTPDAPAPPAAEEQSTLKPSA